MFFTDELFRRIRLLRTYFRHAAVEKVGCVLGPGSRLAYHTAPLGQLLGFATQNERELAELTRLEELLDCLQDFDVAFAGKIDEFALISHRKIRNNFFIVWDSKLIYELTKGSASILHKRHPVPAAGGVSQSTPTK